MQTYIQKKKHSKGLEILTTHSQSRPMCWVGGMLARPGVMDLGHKTLRKSDVTCTHTAKETLTQNGPPSERQDPPPMPCVEESLPQEMMLLVCASLRRQDFLLCGGFYSPATTTRQREWWSCTHVSGRCVL